MLLPFLFYVLSSVTFLSDTIGAIPALISPLIMTLPIFFYYITTYYGVIYTSTLISSTITSFSNNLFHYVYRLFINTSTMMSLCIDRRGTSR